MALPSTRYEFRIALSHVDAGLDRELTLVVARHPSETSDHLTLRVLAACVLAHKDVEMGPGLSDGEGADLIARDATGRVSCWLECGQVAAQKLRKVVQGNAGAEVHVLIANERRRRELDQELAELPHGIRDAQRVFLWRVAPELVEALARREERRQRWSVTVVGGHVYVEVEGESVDGEVEVGGIG